jgi:hypothetical protein
LLAFNHRLKTAHGTKIGLRRSSKISIFRLAWITSFITTEANAFWREEFKNSLFRFIYFTLIIENLDRLSRQGIDATTDLLKQLTRSGIDVHVIAINRVLKAGFNNSLVDYMLIGVQADLAYRESKKKSERIGSAWASKRARLGKQGELYTRNIPEWLTVENGKIVEVPEGQIFMKFAEPAFKLREEIGAIAQDLEMYANEDEKIADAKERLKIFRSHASKLHGILSMILPYDFWQQLFQLPERTNVEGAFKQVFRLSNLQVESRETRTPEGPFATALRIRELLKIRCLTDGEKVFLQKNGQIEGSPHFYR